ncbi:FAD binding domain-containing protein [Pararoseomonas indoligenes]|uniref:FAD binding domain-containing protein n=1 Tax=Roseomonas indoligenes TaxID=2820811 RepID=A0A940S9W5_9PROT|nr:FAD binding domain-containing protein [Pararoseomonas indoligenes]MBP0495718.1 FAD binding domain-containing protein [Pararoseomonas indoligenes]
MKPSAVTWNRAESLEAAATILQDDVSAMPLAGGQSLVVMLGLRVTAAERLVGIAHLPELAGVSEDGAVLRIGAGVTHAAIEDGRIPDATDGLLARVASGIAYRAVRNLGTIGGSLALSDPAADWPVALLALEATVVTTARRIAIGEFLQGAYATALETGELIRAVEIPRFTPGTRWGAYKVARKAGAFADSLCVVVQRPGAAPRIALGATAHGAVLLAAGTAEAIAAADLDADVFRRRCHLASVTRALKGMEA